MAKKKASAKPSKRTKKDFALEGAIEERADGQFEFACVVLGKRYASDPYPTRGQVEADIQDITRMIAKLLQVQHGMIFDTEVEFGPLPPPLPRRSTTH